MPGCEWLQILKEPQYSVSVSGLAVVFACRLTMPAVFKIPTITTPGTYARKVSTGEGQPRRQEGGGAAAASDGRPGGWVGGDDGG